MNKELGIVVTLKKNYPLVAETLERMGIKNSQLKKFFPSCYCIGDDKGVYKIYHFKELFAKEGKESTYNEVDELRRNTIIFLLKKWELIDCEVPITEILVQKIDVLNHNEKPDYRICHKYFFKKLL